jgi:hypothetical protein
LKSRIGAYIADKLNLIISETLYLKPGFHTYLTPTTIPMGNSVKYLENKLYSGLQLMPLKNSATLHHYKIKTKR